jgi:hypothetical protein
VSWVSSSDERERIDLRIPALGQDTEAVTRNSRAD